jgi:hypothetical protein
VPNDDDYNHHHWHHNNNYYSVKKIPFKESKELFTVPDICGLVKNNITYLVTELVFENCIKIYTIRRRQFKLSGKYYA